MFTGQQSTAADASGTTVEERFAMRFTVPILALAAAMLLAWLMVMPAVSEEEKENEATFDFVGVKKCKMCHKSAKSGAQFTIWEESRHAKAYETLASEASIAIAKELGIENPQTAPECLRCHVTAFPVMTSIAEQKITLEESVSCESCHGAGSGYWKKKTMAAIHAGELEGATVGLTEPGEERCVECHNEESPTYKEFKYDEFWAKIAHPVPDEEG
jgi:hypothetical protein